jgi:6-phosphofructokinase
MLKAYDSDIECIGILKGWKGYMENLTIPLNIADHDDLHTVGGTILYTSRTNPFKGVESNDKQKRAGELSTKFDELGIDALIAIGGVLK